MPKEQDPFRKYVKDLEKRKWRCTFCNKEFAGSTPRIRAHLAAIPGHGIKACEKVKDSVRAEALETFNGKGSVLDKSTGGTSGEGRERIVIGASQIGFQIDDGSNPNDIQNSNQPGCVPQQPSCYWPIRTGAASACPQDQVSLYPGYISLDNLDTSQQPDILNHCLEAARENENASSLQQLPMDLPALPSLSPSPSPSEVAALFGLLPHLESGREQQNSRGLSSLPDDQVLGNNMSNGQQEFHGGYVLPTPLLSNITMTSIPQYSNEQNPSFEVLSADESFRDSLLHSTENLRCSLPENLLESHDVDVNTYEERQTNELHNPTVGSSLQIDSSLDVDSANRLQDRGQPCGAEVVPVRSNTCPTDTVQHPGQLPPMCDKEDGNDTRRFPSRTPMDIDISTASQHTNVVDSQVQEASTNILGPSSSHASAPLERQIGPHGSINLTTVHQNPTLPSSSSKNHLVTCHPQALMDKDSCVPSSSQAPNNAPPPPQILPCGTCLIGPSSILELDTNEGAPMTSHLNTRNNFEENGALKRKLGGVNKLLEHVMVGEAFRKNTTKILEYLVGNQISQLGICGMGGVGKTTIMSHIRNRLLDEANYGDVLWITVSRDFKTRKLQDTIWEALGLGNLQEKDVRKRAAMLYYHLMKRGKFTIILDDVWKSIDLTKVGIPVKVDGIKLVLTTRFFDICHQMQCQIIKIEPLSDIEAKSLFLEKLQSEVALNLETKAIVMSVIKECAGLPLAIIMIARSMRGVTNVFEWKDCLEKLKESDIGKTDMEKVLKKLKFSYDRLGDHEYQQCFLSCALYPEDWLIDKFELIEFFIDQGLVVGLNTREKQYDRGLTILQKLVNACLLEDHKDKVKMHDLIRDMALHVMSVTSIVKVGKGLRRIPPEEYWTDALEKVSLMENDIKEFPLNMSPNCPKLSTFLLNENSLYDYVIPDSFFKHLWGIKVLNLSGCRLRELPDSISDLVNLKALLLRECDKLHRIPHLGNLRSLRKLDIFYCVSVEVLEGLEMLVNLRYLDIAHTCIKRLPKGTLGALLNLQCLGVGLVNIEEIAKLCALETLNCFFDDVDDFNKFVRVVSEQTNNPCYYKIKLPQEGWDSVDQTNVGALFQYHERSIDVERRSHAIVSVRGESSSSGNGICILIPQDVRNLRAWNCDGATNLSNMGPLEELEELEIKHWSNLRVLCGGQDEEVIDIHHSPTQTSTPLLFRSLRDLEIFECPKLKYLFGHEPKFYLPHLRRIRIKYCREMVGITVAATSPSPYPTPAFLGLEEIKVEWCDKMKRVVEFEWLPHFPNLRRLSVFNCKNIEEIIGGLSSYMSVEEISPERLLVEGCHELPHCEGMEEMISGVGQGQEGSMATPINNTPSSSQSSISLPKLNFLYLHNLPQLKSICEVPITCTSMKHLEVIRCQELKRIPLELQFCDIEDLPHIVVEGEEKWKTLIWDHPDAQANLQSHLVFKGNRCILEGRRRKSPAVAAVVAATAVAAIAVTATAIGNNVATIGPVIAATVDNTAFDADTIAATIAIAKTVIPAFTAAEAADVAAVIVDAAFPKVAAAVTTTAYAAATNDPNAAVKATVKAFIAAANALAVAADIATADAVVDAAADAAADAATAAALKAATNTAFNAVIAAVDAAVDTSAVLAAFRNAFDAAFDPAVTSPVIAAFHAAFDAAFDAVDAVDSGGVNGSLDAAFIAAVIVTYNIAFDAAFDTAFNAIIAYVNASAATPLPYWASMETGAIEFACGK